MTHQIVEPIKADLGSFLQELAKLGYQLTSSTYDASHFGDYIVELNSTNGWLRIVRDRGQYYVTVASEENLKQADLWRVFDDRGEFESRVLTWLRQTRGLTSA